MLLILGALVIAAQMSLIAFLVVQVRRLRESDETGRALRARIIDTQETERRRIAGELHDNVSQRLALLSLTVEQSLDADAAASIGSQVSAISDDVRDLTHEIHSAALTHVGLTAALRGLGADVQRRHPIALTVEIDDTVPPIGYDLRLCLYRVAQEALNNLVQHSGAATARMFLGLTADTLTLSVTDDGCGFSQDAVGGKQSLGLRGVRERLAQVGGSLAVVSAFGSGTRIEARVPLPRDTSVRAAG